LFVVPFEIFSFCGGVIDMVDAGMALAGAGAVVEMRSPGRLCISGVIPAGFPEDEFDSQNGVPQFWNLAVD